LKVPQPDHISALPVADPQALDEDLRALFVLCTEKLGIVPNVLRAYSLRPQKLRAGLRRAGLGDEDIFDLTETVAFFNMSNRMASGLDIIPNHEYHRWDR
jgi:alkylhydroperoxidase family enzyme